MLSRKENRINTKRGYHYELTTFYSNSKFQSPLYTISLISGEWYNMPQPKYTNTFYRSRDYKEYTKLTNKIIKRCNKLGYEIKHVLG